MDSKSVSDLWASMIVLFLCRVWVVDGQQNVFTVTDFGVFADGKTDISSAMVKAWRKACETDGGILAIPRGNFSMRAANLEGPCNGKTYFKVNGVLIASPNSMEDHWIRFHKIDNLTVSGEGTLDGNGASAWSENNCKHDSNCRLLPTSVWVGSVNNSLIKGIKSVNSKSFHFQIFRCENVSMERIGITSPKDSPNTDGIHISKSNHVSISDSRIATGDDCISFGDGNTNINVTNTWCGPGHGFSIGSLGRYDHEEDVRAITIRNCTVSDTSNGLRIKTFSSSSNSITVSDVVFSDIHVDNVQNPIIIDQYYTPILAQMKEDVGVLIKDVKFINVKGTSATDVAVNVKCSKVTPCEGIVFSGLDLKSQGTHNSTTASCISCKNTFLGSAQVPSHCS